MGDKYLRITIEAKDENYPNYDSDKYVWETEHLDTGLDEILNKLYGMLIGMTWQPQTIGEVFKEKGEEILESLGKKDEENLEV